MAALSSDADSGLTAAEAADRLSRHGPNAIEAEKPPSVWEVALAQLNIILIAVTAVSFLIGEVSTDVIVALLILLIMWAIYATTLFVAALIPLIAGPDDPSPDKPSKSLTMTFVVMGLGTVFNALSNRRDPASGFGPPILKALAIAFVPVALIRLATELPGLQSSLHTASLTGRQWLACIALAALLPLVVETGKWVRRRRENDESPAEAGLS